MMDKGLMLGNWHFDMTNPIVWLLSGLLLLSLLLTLRASWTRLSSHHLIRAIGVVLLNLVAFLTVLAFLLEPHRLQRAEQNVTLLTEGAELTGLHKVNDADLYIAPAMNATSKTREILNNANWLLDVAQLTLRERALTKIEVRGYGLNRSQWQDLPADIYITYQPPAVDGFTGMHWPRKLVRGETLLIAGRLSFRTSGQAASRVIQLKLLDPAGQAIAQTRIRNGSDFTLAVRPKSAGNLAYDLQAFDGDTLLATQTVTVAVVNPTSISIMVEQSAASFETRQLKNFAAAHGTRLLVNTQISKDKFITQTSNFPAELDTAFAPQTLAAMDVLIMDGRALVNLSIQQRQWLEDAVNQGLGLLVKADASLLHSYDQFEQDLLKGISLAASPGSTGEVVPRLLRDPSRNWQMPLPVAAMHLHATEAEILIDDGENHALVVNKRYGLGNIALSLISQTQSWLTSGNREHWSDYWATLIAAVSRPRRQSFILPPADADFYSVGGKIPVCVMSDGERPIVRVSTTKTEGQLMTGQTEFDLPVVADALGSPRLCGWFWAQHSGWHQLRLYSAANGLLLDQQGIYVTDDDQWLAHKRQQRVSDSIDRVANNPVSRSTSARGKIVSGPVGIIWLWILLVVSASLLWLERKLDFGW